MKDKVEQALRDSPRLRDSDLALIGYIWQMEGLHLTDEQKKIFMTLTAPETISRIRRSLRATYPGSDEVEKQRFKKYEIYVDKYGEKTVRFV